MKGKMRFFHIFIMASLLFVSACASNTAQEDPAVQDIQPGETSVIQPPSRQPVDTGKQIEERNI